MHARMLHSREMLTILHLGKQHSQHSMHRFYFAAADVITYVRCFIYFTRKMQIFGQHFVRQNKTAIFNAK